MAIKTPTNTYNSLKMATLLASLLAMASLVACGSRGSSQKKPESCPLNPDPSGVSDSVPPPPGNTCSPTSTLKPKEAKVFSLAKDFADGNKTALDVKNQLETLNSDEKKQFFQSETGTSNLPLLIVMGKASPESREILESYLSEMPSGDDMPSKLLGQELFRESLAASHRPGEDPTERHKTTALILEKFPDQVNNFTKPNPGFEGEIFNAVMLLLNKETATQVLGHLNRQGWSDFYKWVFGNEDKALGQKVFRDTYELASANDKAAMRVKLLEHTFSTQNADNNAILTLIKEAEAWGIKANILLDSYELPAVTTPATSFKGTLLEVLVKQALHEFSQNTPSDPLKAFAPLREYVLELKNLINDAQKFSDAIRPPPSEGALSIFETLQAALKPKHDLFTPYFLALDVPEDVLTAARQSTDVFPNNLLKEFYGLVIGDSTEKNLELATIQQETDQIKSGFIEAITKRKVDAAGDLLEILASFLSKLDDTQVQAQLKGADDTLSPIKILADVTRQGDDLNNRAKMMSWLLEKDEGDFVKNLSQDEIQALTSRKGKIDVKLLNAKLKNSPELAKIVRDQLLNEASSGTSGDLQIFVDEVTHRNDILGLGAGLATDEYTLDGITGNLLMVLAQSATRKSGSDVKKSQAAFGELRSIAQSIKEALGETAYIDLIQQMSPDSIKDVVSTSLKKVNREDFANFYLAVASIDDVEAAVSHVPEVDNATLLELYNLIIKTNQTAADLAAKHGDFLHRLLRRVPNIALYSVLNQFLNAITAHGGEQAEISLITTENNNEKPLGILLKDLSQTNLAEKMRLFSRLSKRATTEFFANLTPVNASLIASQLITNPPEFKRIHGLLTNNANAALAMRNVLIRSIYQNPSWTTLAGLKNLVSEKDPWGLKTGLTTLTYQLDDEMTPTPLLSALVQGAIKKYQADENPDHLANLRTFALSIREALGEADFRSHVQDTHLLADLTTKLGEKFKNFTRSYVGVDEVEDVFAAAANSDVNNDSLKKLFKRIVAKSTEMAKKLADMKSGSQHFIHRVLNRQEDASGHPLSVLNDFLALLTDDSRASQISNLTAESLTTQNLFKAGESGQDVFKMIYKVIKSNENSALIFRSSLLNNALQAGGLASAKVLVDSLADWDLKNDVATDTYQLDNNQGTLLTVLTQWAIKEAKRSGALIRLASKSGPLGPYDYVRQIAQTLRRMMEEEKDESSKKGLFVNYASPATMLLKEELDETHKGFAEYFLDLDNTAPSLNAQLVLDAFDNGKSFSLGHVAWLYQAFMGNETQVKVNDLATLTNAYGSRFLQLILNQQANPESRKLLEQFLNDVADAAKQAEQIAFTGGLNKNALEILLAAGRHDVEEDQRRMLNLLVERADTATIKDIADPMHAQALLTAASKTKPPHPENIVKLFENLHENSMTGVAQWSGLNILSPANDVGALFSAAYAKYPNKQEDMRNTLVFTAYELGRQGSGPLVGSGPNSGIKHVALLIEKGFFSKEAAMADMKPFKGLPSSTLLLAIFRRDTRNITLGLETLIREMKTLLQDEWPAYLTKSHEQAQSLSFTIKPVWNSNATLKKELDEISSQK